MKVNKISPASGTTITLGDSGDTFTIPSGVTLAGFTSTGIDDNADATAITIDSSENVGIGTTSPLGKTQIKVGPADAIICTSYKGHYFESQSDPNTDGFEIYQQHGSNASRNSFIVNDNRTGSKSSAFLVRNDGKVLVGTASTEGYFDGQCCVQGRLHVRSSETDIGMIWNQSTGTGTVNLFRFGRGSSWADKGSITTSGSSVAFNTSSDYRLKENVVPMDGAIDRLNQLKPYRFNFILDPNKVVDGFIAHEAQEVVPEAVTGTKDGMEEYEVAPEEKDEDGNVVKEAVVETREKMQGIDQSKLVPLLVGALQEAIVRIEKLEQEVAVLKGAN